MPTTLTSSGSVARLPATGIACAVLLAIVNLPGENALLTTISLMVLIAGVALLWRPGEPPIGLFIFSYQWLQASISAFHANWLGIDVNAYTIYGGDNKLAVLLTLCGLLFLALGMRLGNGPPDRAVGPRCWQLVQARPLASWFFLYVAASIIAVAALQAAALVPGLAQPLLALAGLRWAFFMMFAYASFVRSHFGNPLFVCVFLGELAMSAGGYFADFKTVMFFTLFAMAMAETRLRGRHVLGGMILVGMIVFSGILWTAIKEDYRNAASGGSASQIVSLDLNDRLGTIAGLLARLDATSLADATGKMLHRISYVELFAVILARVPATIPHEHGALLLDAVSRPLMPRILFAEKGQVDDTRRTNYYTGGLSGIYRGTSISLGYMAELYIDFGPVVMMAVIFALGYLYGRLYKWLVQAPRAGPLLGSACACAILTQAALLEVSLAKLIGGVMVSVLLTALFIRFVAPGMRSWLEARRMMP
ncbi:hypothetical protein [Labrys neptuniae]